MAVDIKSLHIGSHIAINGKRHRISNIDALNGQIGIEAYTTDKDGVKHPFGYPIEQVEAVPITPELLKELGLNVISHGCFEHWFLGNFDLTHNADSRYWDYDGSIRVEFLHELEDLYYLKYGVELIPD